MSARNAASSIVMAIIASESKTTWRSNMELLHFRTRGHELVDARDAYAPVFKSRTAADRGSEGLSIVLFVEA
jgi:hypothetical protein